LTAENLSLETRMMLATSLVKSLPRGEQLTSTEQAIVRPLHHEATALVGNSSDDEMTRCQAMSLLGIGLGDLASESSLLIELLHPTTPLTVQIAAINTLARTRNQTSAEKIVARWPSLSQPVRDACVEAMLSIGTWNEILVQALESGSVKVNDLTAAARQRIRFSGSRSLQVRADRVLGSSGLLEKRQLIEQYLQHTSTSFDLATGERLFKQHCATCHQAHDGLKPVGASLENLSDTSTRFLLESILDPNRNVDPKYQTYTVQTVDDRIIAGIVEEESSNHLVLGHADGTRTKLLRSEITTIKNTGASLMPEGFENQINPQQMQELINWLSHSYRK